MTCNLCEERLSDYLEWALPAEERTLVDEHLKSCSACSELLDGVRNVMNWGKELPAQLPPPWLASRIVANTPQVIRVAWSDWIVGGHLCCGRCPGPPSVCNL
jgi:predicted anti-sigma-YlaC factor YlaD